MPARGAPRPPSNVKCCVPAPPIIEFDQAGKVVQGWGGDGPGYKWGDDGHGIHVDYDNFVWVGDPAESGGHIFKFTRDGKFVMRIGQPGTPTGSNDIAHLGRPADMVVDRDSNELFVADGYGNHRVIVFDATTGAYKRHWGAYGEPAERREDRLGSPRGRRRSSSATRCIASPSPTTGWCWCATAATTGCRCSARTAPSCANSRRRKHSAPGTIGSIAKWPDAAQSYLIVVDDPNGEFHVVDRADGKLLASLWPGRPSARRVLQSPRHRHRQQGQHLHRRGPGQAGAEIPQSRRALAALAAGKPGPVDAAGDAGRQVGLSIFCTAARVLTRSARALPRRARRRALRRSAAGKRG